MNSTDKIYVWDKFIRFFHWNLVLGMIAGYLTAEFDYLLVHSYVGYYLGILLAARIIWGFAGGPYARFTALRFRPREAIAYIFSVLTRRNIRHYQAHNPASASMAVTLMIVLALLLFSGSILYGYVEFIGPMTFLTASFPEGLKSVLEDLHELFFDIIFLLIIFHVAGAVTSSFIHKENLIKAMIHGYRKKHNNTEEH